MPPATEVRRVALVWIDAEGARILRWTGTLAEAVIDADVPVHERSTHHVRHDPRTRHGGGGRGADEVARHRTEHLRRFLGRVEAALNDDDEVDILGTGTLGNRLAAQLKRNDHGHGRSRTITAEHSMPMTDRQLAARLKERIGSPSPRGGRGAYRWTGSLPRQRSGRVTGPRRVVEKRPVDHSSDSRVGADGPGTP
jgi:hypothetical protein